VPATLTIKPWSDPVVDTLGHDPRSRYVETFWLPTLGPTALLLLRHLADRFDVNPDGVELTVSDTSHALGLGQRDGNSSPIVRTLSRLSQFDLACEDPHSNTVAVRRNVPPLNTRHLRRLPSDLQLAHAEWAEAQLAEAPLAAARRVHPARAGRRPRSRRAGPARDRLPPRPVPRERGMGLPTPSRRARARQRARQLSSPAQTSRQVRPTTQPIPPAPEVGRSERRVQVPGRAARASSTLSTRGPRHISGVGQPPS